MRLQKAMSIFLCVVISVTLLCGAVPVKAASSAEIQKEIDALEEKEAALADQLLDLEAQLADNLSEIRQIVAQKDAIDQQIILLYEQIRITDQKIIAYGALVADKQQSLEDANARLLALRQKHRQRIRAMEENGRVSYWSVLFRSKSFSDFLDRLNMIWEIAAADKARLQKISEAAEQATRAKAELEREKERLEATRQIMEQSRAVLTEKRAEADGLLQSLVAKGMEYELLLEEGENKQTQLMMQIAQKEEEFDVAAYQEWLAAQPQREPQPEELAPSPQVPENAEDWLTPVPYYTLTSPFGMRLHPILGIYRMHNGIDMACAEGTPIYASRGGQISVAAYQENGAGNYVQINHGDGYRSIYMHMTRYIVAVGDYVTAGQVIGYVGNTGLSKGNHLHFGISYKGEYINPLEHIG